MEKPSVVSEREKSIIVALAKVGVSTPVLASAFGVPKQAIAAFKAWDTMRSTPRSTPNKVLTKLRKSILDPEEQRQVKHQIMVEAGRKAAKTRRLNREAQTRQPAQVATRIHRGN